MRQTIGNVLVVFLFSVAVAGDETTILQTASTGTVDRSVEAGQSKAEINVLQDSSRVSVRLARSISRSDEPVFSVWSLTASAPINKSEDKTNIATLDSLANSFVLGVKYLQLRAPGKKPARALAINESFLDDVCNELTRVYQRKMGKKDEPLCDTNNVKQYLPSKYAAFKSLFWDPDKRKYVWGLEAQVGYERFEFTDPVTLEDADESKTPLSGKAFFAFDLPKKAAMFTFGAEYQKGFKNADNRTFCEDDPTVAPAECKSGPWGEPEDDDRQILSTEFRKLIGSSGAGVSAKLSYDFEKEVFGVDVPVFLFSDKKGKLRGGIRTGWRDDTRDLQLGVFVGTAFSLY